MRIISGTHKGRRIQAPNNLPVRPTTDRAKEALFNILQHRFFIQDISVLDLCAGIGSLTFESASRGAEKVWAIDSFRKCVEFIDKTSEALGFDQVTAIEMDALAFARTSKEPFDLILADPPYDADLAIPLAEAVMNNPKMLAEDGLFILEHGADTNVSEIKGYVETRKYGHVHFSFFEA